MQWDSYEALKAWCKETGQCPVCKLQSDGPGVLCLIHRKLWKSQPIGNFGAEERFLSWVNLARYEADRPTSYVCAICEQMFVSEDPDYLCPRCLRD